MKKNMLEKTTTKVLIIFTLLLFIISPLEVVKADNYSNSEVVEEVKEEKEEDYSTLYVALVISLVSLGLVFLNKKDSTKEVKKESTKSIKNKEKKEARIQRNNQENNNANKKRKGK